MRKLGVVNIATGERSYIKFRPPPLAPFPPQPEWSIVNMSFNRNGALVQDGALNRRDRLARFALARRLFGWSKPGWATFIA